MIITFWSTTYKTARYFGFHQSAKYLSFYVNRFLYSFLYPCKGKLFTFMAFYSLLLIWRKFFRGLGTRLDQYAMLFSCRLVFQTECMLCRKSSHVGLPGNFPFLTCSRSKHISTTWKKRPTGSANRNHTTNACNYNTVIILVSSREKKRNMELASHNNKLRVCRQASFT